MSEIRATVDPARAAENKTAQIAGVTTVFHVIALLIVILRSYTRIFIIRNFGFQDAFMILSVVSYSTPPRQSRHCLPSPSMSLFQHGESRPLPFPVLIAGPLAVRPSWRHRDHIYADTTWTWPPSRYHLGCRSYRLQPAQLRPVHRPSDRRYRLPQNRHRSGAYKAQRECFGVVQHHPMVSHRSVTRIYPGLSPRLSLTREQCLCLRTP